jgi:hypothetical protein
MLQSVLASVVLPRPEGPCSHTHPPGIREKLISLPKGQFGPLGEAENFTKRSSEFDFGMLAGGVWCGR